MDILKAEFVERQRRNVHYTLRSFARDLSIHRELLGQGPESSQGQNSRLNVGLEAEQLNYSIIAEWEHFAILSMIGTKGFREDFEWIGKRLGISKLRVEAAFERLLAAGLLKVTPKRSWIQVNSKWSTSDEVASSALKRAHDEELTMARKHLHETPLHLRDQTSLTFACHPRALGLIRKVIRTCLKEVEALAEGKDATEVFQLCVNVFPLTNVSHNHKEFQ
ncbi:MAG: DUF4423 domain-containing protein [Proteobacteria bacterium]|nr:DUF4423 domain-containing protein [Pseudomonadota bacterium]